MAMKRIAINVDSDLLAQIDQKARELGINRTSCIAVMCSEYLRNDTAIKTMQSMLPLMQSQGTDRRKE